MSTISASTTSTTAFKITTDTTGALVFQTGASPTTALTLDASSNLTLATGYLLMANYQAIYWGATNKHYIYGSSAGGLFFGTNNADRVNIDTSGNLGLGVTPSAWSGFKAIQVQQGCFASNQFAAGNLQTFFGSNVIYDGSYKYAVSGSAAARYAQNEAAHIWFSAPSGTAGSAITFTQAMTLNASGYLAVGDQTSPTTRLDIRGTSANVASTVQIVGTGVSTLLLGQNADGGVIRGQGGNNSLTFYTGGTGDTAASGSGSARAFLTSGGLFSAGDTPGYLNLGYFRFNYGVGQGTLIFCVSSYPTVNEDTIRLYSVTTGGMSTAGSAMQIAKNGGTSRSINAAGTVNASGADYAEYMVKAGEFSIAKGDVVGINTEGKLTTVFTESVSFVVKSTNPSYVGGDTWFDEKQPVNADMKPVTEGPIYDAWVARMEAARATVDRIAFSGQVPVNVTGATPGQFIIPVNDNGTIKGQAVSSPTFEQYQQAVGKVIAIEQDGRARIIVKVS